MAAELQAFASRVQDHGLRLEVALHKPQGRMAELESILNTEKKKHEKVKEQLKSLSEKARSGVRQGIGSRGGDATMLKRVPRCGAARRRISGLRGASTGVRATPGLHAAPTVACDACGCSYCCCVASSGGLYSGGDGTRDWPSLRHQSG